jgi:hypothetical protein
MPWLVFEPAVKPLASDAGALSTPAVTIDSTEQPSTPQAVALPSDISVVAWLDDAGIQIIRATRSWIQYGTVGFAVICIVIGAVEGLIGR